MRVAGAGILTVCPLLAVVEGRLGFLSTGAINANN